MLLEVGLVGIEHAIEPGEELVGAVVGVEDNGDTVRRGDSAGEDNAGSVSMRTASIRMTKRDRQ